MKIHYTTKTIINLYGKYVHISTEGEARGMCQLLESSGFLIGGTLDNIAWLQDNMSSSAYIYVSQHNSVCVAAGYYSKSVTIEASKVLKAERIICQRTTN